MLLRPISRCLRPGLLSFSTVPSSLSQKPPVLAIRREEKKWERRAPLNPNHVQTLVRSGVKVLLQPSTRRSYSMQEYEAAGAILTENISEADTIMGVKEVPVDRLIEDKTYVFFSHTIKAQEDNMPMLDAILNKGIRLVDYEMLLDEQGRTVQAPMSKFAGMAGMVDILYGLGLRLLGLGYHTPFMHVGMAHNYPTLSGAKAAIASLGREIQYGLLPESLGPLIFTFTGAGNVSQGAQEVFRELPHEYVPPSSLKEVMETGDMRKVYATVVLYDDEHLVRKDGQAFDNAHFNANPEMYMSTFGNEIAPYTTCLVNGVYWGPNFPRLITTDQCRTLHPLELDLSYTEGVPMDLPQRLLAISDISCDFNGSLEFMSHSTTLDNPFVLYNAHTETMSDDMTGNGIVICSIDHMPTELGREATDQFGNTILPFVHQFLRMDGKLPLKECTDVSRAVKDAVIAYGGSLTDKYAYIEALRRQNDNNGSGEDELKEMAN